VPSAVSAPSTTRRSMWRPGRSPLWSDRTAPASRRCSTWSRASSLPSEDECSSKAGGSTVRNRTASRAAASCERSRCPAPWPACPSWTTSWSQRPAIPVNGWMGSCSVRALRVGASEVRASVRPNSSLCSGSTGTPAITRASSRAASASFSTSLASW